MKQAAMTSSSKPSAGLGRRGVEARGEDQAGERGQHAHVDEGQEGQPLGLDARQLCRLLVAADRVDPPADRGAPGHEAIERDQRRHDDKDVRQAAVGGDQVGEIEHRAGQHDALAEEERVRLDLDAMRLFARAASRAGIDERECQHRDPSNSEVGCSAPASGSSSGMKPELSFWNVGRKRADRLALQQRERKALEHQHAGQRDDEGRNPEIGHPIALRRADRRAHQQAGDEGQGIVDVIADHQHRGDRADEARDRADREVDMAGDDHQQHAERHDDDVAVLQDEIGEVERLQQRAVGHDLEEQHDREQRQQHAVVAQVVLDEPAMPAFLGKRNRLVGHGCTAPIGTSFAPRAVLDVPVAHDGPHDVFLRRLGCRKLADEGAVVHHADPVADAEQFRHFRRDHHDALAGRRQLVDDTINLVFCADVDAAGRLVEDQDLGIGQQPFRQHDLLLVAAGELARLLIDVGAADAHPGPVIAGRPQFVDVVDHPARGDPVEACQRDVLAHVVGEDQPELLAVLGDIGKAGVDRGGNAGEIDLAAVEADAAADVIAPGTAEQAHRELGAARAHQAGNADDLAAPHVEVDVLDRLPLGMERMVDRPVLHNQHSLPDRRFTLRKAVCEVAVDHAADDPVLLDRLGPAIDVVDGAAVAQHGDAVGDVGDLVQLVRDQDRGDALLAERDQTIEQRRAVGLVEAGGRLVQDQQPYPLGKRLGDLDQLLLADAEIGDQRVRLFAQADLGQQFPGALGTPRHGR